MLVVLGGPAILDDLSRGHRLREFVRSGGRVLIATDRPTSAVVYEEIGVQISGETWAMPEGVSHAIYRGSLRDCPLVIDFARAQSGRPTAPFFRGEVTDTGSPITMIATNRPSSIQQFEGYVPVATLFQIGR